MSWPHRTNSLSIKNIACQRGQRWLFKSINFSLSSGEALFVKGANGTGKSSLLRIVAGLLSPDHGDVIWQDQIIAKHPENYYPCMSYLGHKNGIKLNLTVSENLRFAAVPADKELLQRFNLTNYLNVLCSHLSQGQRQRLALLKLVLKKSALWILDEPLAALDNEAARLMQNLFNEHIKNSGILIITSHQQVDLDGTKVKELVLN